MRITPSRAIIGGGSGVLGLVLLSFLLSTSTIELVEISPGETCVGSVELPCYARIVFISHDELLIYPNTTWSTGMPVGITNISFSLRELGTNNKHSLTSECRNETCGGRGRYAFRLKPERTYEYLLLATKETPQTNVNLTFNTVSKNYTIQWNASTPPVRPELANNCANESIRLRITRTPRCSDEPANQSCRFLEIKENVLNYTYYYVPPGMKGCQIPLQP